MIGDDQLALMKPTAFIVNVARGGLIDEDALYRALSHEADRRRRPRRVRRASRPPTRRCSRCENVVVTPHLGASTDEAQEKAGVSVAKSVRLALSGELVPDAVNVAGGVIDPYVRPGIPLVEKLGQVFSGLAHSPLTSVDVEVRGELVDYDVSVLKLAALKGIFTNVVSETVSYVNAPLLAEQRGIEVRLHHRLGERGVPQPDHPARRAQRRLADLGLRHPHRHRSRSRRSSRSTATTSRSRSPSTSSSWSTTTVPASSPIYGHEFGEAEINIAGMQIARTVGGRQGAQRAHRRLPRARGSAREGARRDRRRPDAGDRHHGVLKEHFGCACRFWRVAYVVLVFTSAALKARDVREQPCPTSMWCSSRNPTGTRMR